MLDVPVGWIPDMLWVYFRQDTDENHLLKSSLGTYIYAVFELSKNYWLSHGQPGYNFLLSVQVLVVRIWNGWDRGSQPGHENLLVVRWLFWLCRAHGQPKFRTLLLSTVVGRVNTVNNLASKSVTLVRPLWFWNHVLFFLLAILLVGKESLVDASNLTGRRNVWTLK